MAWLTKLSGRQRPTKLFESRKRPAGPVCLACDSEDLETLAALVYRCRACGHDGGDGLPGYLRERSIAAILALDPDARRALAGRSLIQARHVLVGINLETTNIHAGLGAGIGGANDAAEEHDRMITNAVRELAEAERLLLEASLALDHGAMRYSITAVPLARLYEPGVLGRYRKGLLEFHASMAKLFA